MIADVVVLDDRHAHIGADALGRWGLPAQMVEAVCRHHEPEQGCSLLAPMLYVAENLSESDENLPSAVRLAASLDQLGLGSVADLMQAGTKDERVF